MFKLLAVTLLLTSSLMAISSNSWFLMWAMLEVNMMMMIPTLATAQKESSSESAMKYFMIQAFASIFFLLGIFLSPSHHLTESPFFQQLLILTALLLKLAAAPFHFWFPTVMNSSSWLNCALLATLQKLAPLALLLGLKSPMMILPILASATVGSIGGFNQTMLKSVISYSSISHSAWLLTALLMNSNLLLLYFNIYSLTTIIIISIFHTQNMKKTSEIILNNPSLVSMLLFINMMSLGGVPPLLGFMPKWFILEKLMFMNPSLLLILIMSSLITLFFYMRLTYLSFLMTPSAQWTMKYNLTFTFTLALTMASILPLPIFLLTPIMM